MLYCVNTKNACWFTTYCLWVEFNHVFVIVLRLDFVIFSALYHLRMGVRRGGKTGISPCGNWGWEPKFSKRTEVSSLIPINWSNSCNDSLFAGMTFTLRKNHVYSSGITHWWACSSLMSVPLPAEEVAKVVRWLFYCWSLLHNNNMATNLQKFTSSYYGSRRFATCVCWTQTSCQVAECSETVRVVLLCVIRSMSESVAMLPQLWKIYC